MQTQTINHVITWHFILACDVYGTIGDGARMPWDSLDGDLERFKQLTTDKAVVMGRNTYESLPFFPKGLPRRVNYVLSNKYTCRFTDNLQILAMSNRAMDIDEFKSPSIIVHNSFSRISNLIERIASDVVSNKIPTDVWVIGGPAIWRQFANMEETGTKIIRVGAAGNAVIHSVTFKGVEEVHLSLVTVPQRGSITYPEALNYLSKAVRGKGWEVVSKISHASSVPNTPPYNYYHIKRKE